METKKTSNEQESYAPSGGKHSIPGFAFQLKLLMLFIIRAVNNCYPCFRLATEMKDADKFDDVIFFYPKNKQHPNAGQFCRFLQAKHTTCDTSKKKIRASDLFNETDGDFSLQKYFKSFRILLGNEKLIKENDEIKDVIICTNMLFKYGDSFRNFILKESIFECVKCENGDIFLDDILLTKLLCFKEDFEGKSEVALFLRNSLINLPKKFAQCVIYGKEYVHEKCQEINGSTVYNLYETALLDEVVNCKTEKFRPDFIEMVNLSAPAKHFHDALKSEYMMKVQNWESNTGKTFLNVLREMNLKLAGNLNHPLRQIEEPNKISKKLTDLLRRNKDTQLILVHDDKSVIKQNINFLMKTVLYEKDGYHFIRPSFLNDTELPGNFNLFRDLLKKNLAHFNMELSEIGDFRFIIKQNIETCIDDEIEYFFKKLVFAVDQVNEIALDDVIMKEIKKQFKDADAKSVHQEFFISTFNWMKKKEVTYFTEKDAQDLFDGLRKKLSQSVRFDLRDPVHNFIGREKELAALRGHFKNMIKRKGCNVVISQSAAVSGLGGIGKSELSRKYAQTFSSDYDNIVWIDCESILTMESSFCRLAFDTLGISNKNINGEDKKIQSIVDEVYLHFCGKTNLFIFDNANKLRSHSNQDDGIFNYLPKTSELSEFHFLITSRNQNWGNINMITLENFTEIEALEFLKNSIGQIDNFTESEALLLANKLIHFPLALQQAASYIWEYNKKMKIIEETFTISDYLTLFEEAALELLDYEFPSYSCDMYTKTTFTTWKITLRHIESLQYGKIATQIFHLMSYLAPDNIDLIWISDALNIKSKIELSSAIALLKQYSMISVQGSNLKVHSLVQLVTRCNLKQMREEPEVLRSILKSAHLLSVEHAITAWSFVDPYTELVCEFNGIPSNIVFLLLNDFKHTEALSFAQRALVTMEKLLEPDHLIIAKIKEQIGIALNYKCKYKESLKLLEEVYQSLKETIGENHPETLSVMVNISMIYDQLYEYKLALNIATKVIDTINLTGQETNVEMLRALNTIATVFLHVGNFEASLQYYEYIYKIERNILGESHEFTLTRRINISTVLIELGRFDEALVILEDTIDKRRAVKGNFDHIVVDCMLNTAFVLEKKGNYKEALRLSEEIIFIHTKVYGENHPNTLNARSSFASLLIDIKREREALEICKDVSNSLKALVGNDHQYTLTSMSYMAKAYWSLNNFKEAKQINEDVYATRIRLHGKDHFLTLYSKNFLALSLFYLGEYKKSLDMFESIYRNLCSSLGEGHYRCLNVKHNIALVLHKQKKYSLSLKMFTEIYQERKVILGENHPETLATKACSDSLLGRKFHLSKDMFYTGIQ